MRVGYNADCQPLLQLWHAYLRERRLAVRGLAIKDAAITALNNTYERSLVSMHKMPRVWLEYLVRRQRSPWMD